jgi:multicomponent Na+:H+ antiporter subunit G
MLRILVVLFLLFLLNPVIAHATIRAAYRAGLKPQANGEQE